MHCLFVPQMFAVEHSLISDNRRVFGIYAIILSHLCVLYLYNFHWLIGDNRLYTGMSNFL